MLDQAEADIATRTQVVTPGLTALAFYDRAWRSWIDCFLLHQELNTTLIDCGKPEHAPALIAALKALQTPPEAVGHLVFTHGHVDHCGGSSALPSARGIVHSLDRQPIADRWMPAGGLQTITGQDGVLELGATTLCHKLVGNHTPGSWVLWHAASAALFCGDFLCWFNEDLPAGDGIVVDVDQLETRLRRFVGWWTSSPRFPDAEAFRRALVAVSRCWRPRYLCSGHGPVLRGDIAGFLSRLADVSPSP